MMVMMMMIIMMIIIITLAPQAPHSYRHTPGLRHVLYFGTQNASRRSGRYLKSFRQVVRLCFVLYHASHDPYWTQHASHEIRCLKAIFSSYILLTSICMYP